MDGLSNPTFGSPIFLSVTQGALGCAEALFSVTMCCVTTSKMPHLRTATVGELFRLRLPH